MIERLKHHWNVSSRREFFTRAGSGLAGIALTSMLAEDGYAGRRASTRSWPRSRTILRPRSPSSSCLWKAGRAMSTCSIQSRS